VLKALGGSGVPVPTVRLHCEDTSVIGSEFFVMDWVKGRIFLDPSLPGMTPAERRAVFTDYLRVLAKLHAIDPAAVGLSDYGRPGNYYERQISRWVRQYKAAQTDDHPDMERLMEWLPAHMPAESETRIVHGDFSIRNCMLHPTEPKLEAVLDWELSTLGDPYSDVAYTTLFMMGETTQKTLTDLGIPSQAEMFEIYAEASGRPALKDWSFHLAFTLFRIAAINQGVYKRGLDGNASSDRYVEAYPSIQRYAARAWSIANGGPAVV
jgi:aminoglycoside phosphotransferase (APT) family kinase protein